MCLDPKRKPECVYQQCFSVRDHVTDFTFGRRMRKMLSVLQSFKTALEFIVKLTKQCAPIKLAEIQ